MKAEPVRSIDQNNKMWAMLTDIANQLPWLVNGELIKIAPKDWKQILTAYLKREQRMAAGIDGGFVMLGRSTSKMTISEMGELIDLMDAFGADREIKWSDPNETTP